MLGGGIPSLIMRKTVGIDMVTFPRYRHWREILTEVKWQKRWTLFHRFLSLDDFDIFRRRNDESICHVSDDLIRHHKNWCPKLPLDSVGCAGRDLPAVEGGGTVPGRGTGAVRCSTS